MYRDLRPPGLHNCSSRRDGEVSEYLPLNNVSIQLRSHIEYQTGKLANSMGRRTIDIGNGS
ncbi:hypothetical protein C5167_021505 [Papaver somniferum]|nr:hypothetical protein C5167_021505 [Papaver somniferum]